MLPPNLQTPSEVRRHYDSVYASLIEKEHYTPFLYPWAASGAAIIVVYLLLDYRKSPLLRSFRFPVFGAFLAFEVWSLLNHKARTSAPAYGVGLVSAWGTLWVATVMVFHDFQNDFRRVERTDSEAVKKVRARANGSAANGAASARKSATESLDDEANSTEIKLLQASEDLATQAPNQRTGPMIWQAYPSQPFVERLDWVADLFCGFRGVGWNFGGAGTPALPAQVQAELRTGRRGAEAEASSTAVGISRTGLRRFHGRRQLLAYTVPRLVAGYLLIDAVTVLMHHDPHFWGYVDMGRAPPAYLPAAVRGSAALLRTWRLLLCLTGVCGVLVQIFRLGPLVFAGVLGPRALGLRGAAWLSPPDSFGSFTPVLEKGLAGWWGGFWHQTFRYAFETPGVRLLAALGVDARSQKGRGIALFVAFFLSGCLHACGSWTQLGDTRPLRGPMCFFLLQAMGITAQTWAAAWLKGVGVTEMLPAWVRRGTNALYAVGFMYLTAPLLMDDFARGGVWLFEPVPISPLRAFGLGAKDDGWYDLWFGMVSWRRGQTWWDTGIAF